MAAKRLPAFSLISESCCRIMRNIIGKLHHFWLSAPGSLQQFFPSTPASFPKPFNMMFALYQLHCTFVKYITLCSTGKEIVNVCKVPNTFLMRALALQVYSTILFSQWPKHWKYRNTETSQNMTLSKIIC